ncbi:uncharacterized protein [Acropora muricata]|uniref:uncharacterized protein n=1 Tax=Acropora muricata TaxID=159855 RepID=UPI0034E5E405
MEKEPEEFQMLVHLFGGVASPSCANYALQKTADENAEHFDQETIQTVKRNFYVDDCLKSVEDDQQARRLVNQLRQLLAKGAFRLTKWISNAYDVIQSVPVSERAGSVKELDPENLPIERALGILWDVQSDRFRFKIVVKDRPPTRRASSQLHNFSDASGEGYGAVSYLRFVNEAKDVHCAFLIGKSRQTPQKSITIPRLELSAAVVATRLNRMMKHELDVTVDREYFWTDSTCVLSYIVNKDKRFQTFVANRITTIHEGSRPDQWYYVHTCSNPADDASRGLSAEEFIHKNRWINGPSFLWEAEDFWPRQPDIPAEIREDDPEVKKERKAFSVASTVEDDSLNRMI